MKLRQLIGVAIFFMLAMKISFSLAQQTVEANGVNTLGQRIQFQSITPKSRFEFVRHTGDNKPVTVFGDLFVPASATGPVPAVVISHGGSGAGAAMYDVWARAFVSWGYAAFVVDSFTPRGLTNEAMNNASVIDPMSNVADALNALKVLAADPRIDPKRIANIGFSRGGGAVIDTYFDMFRHGVIAKDSDLKFAANIPVYPNGCNMKFRSDWANTNRAPMLFLLAEKDESTTAEACIAYIKELNTEAGLNIQYKVYPGVDHAFDSHTKWHFNIGAESPSKCDVEVHMTDIPGSGVQGIDRRTGKAITTFEQLGQAWNDCGSHRGYAVSGNQRATDEALADVHAFLAASF